MNLQKQGLQESLLCLFHFTFFDISGNIKRSLVLRLHIDVFNIFPGCVAHPPFAVQLNHVLLQSHRTLRAANQNRRLLHAVFPDSQPLVDIVRLTVTGCKAHNPRLHCVFPGTLIAAEYFLDTDFQLWPAIDAGKHLHLIYNQQRTVIHHIARSLRKHCKKFLIDNYSHLIVPVHDVSIVILKIAAGSVYLPCPQRFQILLQRLAALPHHSLQRYQHNTLLPAFQAIHNGHLAHQRLAGAGRPLNNHML